MFTPRLSTLNLEKEDMKFSAGHFTMFSATERERLHGHNFTVGVSITAEVLEHGMCFDYGTYKDIIKDLCRAWNEYFILPAESPFLKIEQDHGTELKAIFNGEAIPFLKKDVLLLPIVNATLEEFSRLFLEALTQDAQALANFKIHQFEVRISSGPGQSASAEWKKP